MLELINVERQMGPVKVVTANTYFLFRGVLFGLSSQKYFIIIPHRDPSHPLGPPS